MSGGKGSKEKSKRVLESRWNEMSWREAVLVGYENPMSQLAGERKRTGQLRKIR
jgi:hypothetical protein